MVVTNLCLHLTQFNCYSMKGINMKLLTWLKSLNNQSTALTVLGCTSIAVSSGYFTLHTLLVEQYKELVHLYRFGIPAPVTTEVNKIVNQVLDDLNLSEFERALIKPFTVTGFDMFHAGTTYSRFGAHIGIPNSFNYKSDDSIEKSLIQVNNEPVPWQSEDGINLAKSLILSEEAKKYAVACQVVYTRSLYLYLNTIYPALVAGCLLNFINIFQKKTNLSTKHISVKIVFYSLASCFGFGIWALMKDATNLHLEKSTDEQVCALGEQYVRGGVEFYSKILARNVALRNLMGSSGKRMFSASGNEEFLIRQKRLPIVSRKLFVESKLSSGNLAIHSQ